MGKKKVQYVQPVVEQDISVNGIRLNVKAYCKSVNSSSRWDAKAIGGRTEYWIIAVSLPETSQNVTLYRMTAYDTDTDLSGLYKSLRALGVTPIDAGEIVGVVARLRDLAVEQTKLENERVGYEQP